MTNDTGLHPTDGYILAEHLPIEQNTLITIPDKFKNGSRDDESTHKVVVLEDSRHGIKDKNTGKTIICGFACGTRILTTQRVGFKHRGRDILMLKYDEVVAWYDPDPVAEYQKEPAFSA